ncbi:hypothetical protein G9A89_011852 [Geosiphon pyriformis]|nr:hypothetical protein G9A89_011852 [Geosiphon pyriformis]
MFSQKTFSCIVPFVQVACRFKIPLKNSWGRKKEFYQPLSDKKGLIILLSRGLFPLYQYDSISVAVNFREYHSTRPFYAKKGPKKPPIKQVKIDDDDDDDDDDETDSEDEDLFSPEIVIGPVIEEPKEIQESIYFSFKDMADDIIKKTSLSQIHSVPHRWKLQRLIALIQDQNQAQQMPSIISRWRKKGLPMDHFTTQYLVQQCVKFHAEETAFKVLADRQKYAQFPLHREFRTLMKAFSDRIGRRRKIKQKMKNLPSAKENIVDGKVPILAEERNRDMMALDEVYKCFGLMTYYNVSQFDPHSFAILILAAMKVDSKVAWARADITAKELINLLEKEDIRIVEQREIDDDRKERLMACFEAANMLTKAYKLRNQSVEAEQFQKYRGLWQSEIKHI